MSTENNQPDMIAQVGKMLGRLKAGMAGTDGNASEADDRTIVLSSAILAVAAEGRDFTNELRTLNDTMAKLVGIIAAYDLVLASTLDARRAEEAREAIAVAAADVGM